MIELKLVDNWQDSKVVWLDNQPIQIDIGRHETISHVVLAHELAHIKNGHDQRRYNISPLEEEYNAWALALDNVGHEHLEFAGKCMATYVLQRSFTLLWGNYA